MATNKETSPYIVFFTLDFETGGLNCQTSAITQIALHATRLDTFERLGSYVRYVYPYEKKDIKGVTPKRRVLKSKYDVEEKQMMDYEDKALQYSDISMDKLYEQGEIIEEVAQGALQFFQDHIPAKCPKNMKPFILGQNIEFDKGFFMQMMERAGLVKEVSKILRGTEDFYGHWQPLVVDTLPLAQAGLCHKSDITSYKLELICEQLGIELDDAHDADADVSATTNVLAVLTQRMRSSAGSTDNCELKISKTEKTRKHFKI